MPSEDNLMTRSLQQEKHLTDIESGHGRALDDLRRDLEYLANVIGVTLPSHEASIGGPSAPQTMLGQLARPR